VQRIQKEVASQRKTLFWDWQQAMGGHCSMKRWIGRGLGRGDGVHFTAAGYAQLGDDLYQGLDGLARRWAGNDHASQTGHANSQSIR
jgi:lysophospholipase L1-like esterase